VPDWTVEEARAYLPRLRLILELLRRSVQVSARARSNGHGGAPDGPGSAQAEDGSGSSPPADAPAGDAVAGGLSGLGPSEALAELEDRGIVLRDLDRGLVDFPSRHPGGRQVLLCWQLGEPDLAWWHLPEEGFAGRRPLPLPPRI
jgi:hypothetical protein